MVAAWILIITLSLPSFGGPIVITVTTQTKAGCEKFRPRARHLHDNQSGMPTGCP